MGHRCPFATMLALCLMGGHAAGQGQGARPRDDEPLLRLEAGGPTTLVTALACSPDGKALYEAGWDKVVRVWARDEQAGGFTLDRRATYRLPIGPGVGGAINAMS